MSVTKHPTLYVLQYGNLDMEEETYSCLVEKDQLDIVVKSEIEEFTKNAEDCDMENFRVYSNTIKGDILVNLEDEHGRVTEWQRLSPATIADYS